MERSSRFAAKGLLRSLLTVRATSSVHVTVPDAQDIPDSSFTGEWFHTVEGHRRTASNVVVGGRNVTKRVEITVPKPIYNHLRLMAKANLTSVGKEARRFP